MFSQVLPVNHQSKLFYIIEMGGNEHSILDALFALGKSEKDFKWVSVTEVIRLNNEVSDFCYNYLKGKRKARGLDDIYCQLIIEGYLTFNVEELLNHLIKDERFEFQNDGSVHSTLVKVKRKSEHRNSEG